MSSIISSSTSRIGCVCVSDSKMATNKKFIMKLNTFFAVCRSISFSQSPYDVSRRDAVFETIYRQSLKRQFDFVWVKKALSFI